MNGIFLEVSRSKVSFPKQFSIYKLGPVRACMANWLIPSVEIVYIVLSGEVDGWRVLLNHPDLPEYRPGDHVMYFPLIMAREKYPWLFKDKS